MNGNTKYTKKVVLKEAKGFQSIISWSENSSATYAAACRNGWVKEASKHMSRPIKKLKWTKEEVVKNAKMFSSSGEWFKKSPETYHHARRHGWFKEIKLTFPVFPKIKKWNKESVALEANKFKHLVEWKRGSNGSYQCAAKEGWTKELSAHMTPIPKGEKWLKEDVLAEARMFSTRIEWKANKEPSYAAALRNGWSEEACAHMGRRLTEKWDIETITEESIKFDSIHDWKTLSPSSYDAACKRDLLCKLTAGMISRIKNWTNEEVLEEAKKHEHKSEWFTISQSSYSIAKKRGIFEEATKHMIQVVGTSNPEKNILEIIRESHPRTYSAFFSNKKSEKYPFTKLQIDAYIPELKRGVEFDGTYWHSFAGLKRGKPHWKDEDLLRYHEIKDEFFADMGIEILHIKEKDWTDNKEHCISLVREFLEKGL